MGSSVSVLPLKLCVAITRVLLFDLVVDLALRLTSQTGVYGKIHGVSGPLTLYKSMLRQPKGQIRNWYRLWVFLIILCAGPERNGLVLVRSDWLELEFRRDHPIPGQWQVK